MDGPLRGAGLFPKSRPRFDRMHFSAPTMRICTAQSNALGEMYNHLGIISLIIFQTSSILYDNIVKVKDEN